ncbi:DinB family protein [Nocardioides agariphilus]
MTQQRRYPDMWVDPEDDPREAETNARGEKAVLAEYLDHYRKTLEMKCDGLDAEQLARRSVPPSTMSLLGLVRHMAAVEHSWFQRQMQAKDEPRLFGKNEDRDADFNEAVADQAVVDEAFATWREQIAAADAFYEGVDDLGATVDLDGHEVEIRDIVVHMIEEYARHCGHADLLRECIDGRTGQ